MKIKPALGLFCFCLLPFAFCLPAAAQGTAFTYQGRLNVDGAPANGSFDLRFKLFVDPLGNNQAGGTVLSNGLPVTNGLFAVVVDFGAGIFNGSNYWLEVDVKTNGGVAYTDLSPLQTVTPAPYAIFAENIGSGALAGSYGSALTFNNAANQFSGTFVGNGAGVTNVNALTLNGLGAGAFWRTGGNGGTTPGTNFVGTTDFQPLEFHVNGVRALRFEPNTNGAPNLIGGAPVNYVSNGVWGATVSGGGAVSFLYTNRVLANLGTVGGGAGNTAGGFSGTVGGGFGNTASGYSGTVGGGTGNAASGVAATVGGGNVNIGSGDYAFIGGGVHNAASGVYATVSGGQNNAASANFSFVGGGGGNTNAEFYSAIAGGQLNLIQQYADHAFIGGGQNNIIVGSLAQPVYDVIGGGQGNVIQTNSSYAVIGGGFGNTIQANSWFAVIPGGSGNLAGGTNSFAAGASAQATNNGAFVWADTSTTNVFNSTGSNQFLIRAAGGVGIGTTSPQANLHVVTGGEGIRVQGPGSGAANQAYISFADNAGTRIGYVGDGSTGDSDVVLDSDSGDVVLNTAAGRVMTVTSTGNVGIGTNNPIDMLDVAGSAHIDGALFVGNSATAGPGSGYTIVVYNDSFFYGKIGIGRNALVNMLELEGNASKTTAGSWLANSDARIKTDVHTVSGALEKLDQVRLVSFRYTDGYRAQHPSVEDHAYVNVIAQEFQKVFPEAVTSGGDKTPDGDNILQVDTYPLTIYSAAAIQELNRKVDCENAALLVELKRRDAENAELKKRLDALERIIRNQKSN